MGSYEAQTIEVRVFIYEHMLDEHDMVHLVRNTFPFFNSPNYTVSFVYRQLEYDFNATPFIVRRIRRLYSHCHNVGYVLKILKKEYPGVTNKATFVKTMCDIKTTTLFDKADI